jgi:hypothetical protein
MSLRRLALILLLPALLVLAATDPARARNVPGSAEAMGNAVGEEATGMIIDGITGDIRKLRGDDRPAGGVVPFLSTQNGTTMVNGFDGVIAGAQFSFVGALRYRDIDTDDVDYGLTTASALMVGHLDSRTLLFGGLLMERGNGDTPANDGTMEHDGLGLAIGIDRALSENTWVQATLGHMWLGYDFTRSGGAVSGSYDASRTFLDLTGAHQIVMGKATTELSGGLRYISQTNDAHVELGGSAVPETRGESFSVVFGARTSFALEGGIDPFVEVDLRQNLSSSDNLPASVSDLTGADTHGRLGLGITTVGDGYSFETGVGSNFTEDGYSGLDAHLRLNLSF